MKKITFCFLIIQFFCTVSLFSQDVLSSGDFSERQLFEMYLHLGKFELQNGDPQLAVSLLNAAGKLNVELSEEEKSNLNQLSFDTSFVAANKFIEAEKNHYDHLDITKTTSAQIKIDELIDFLRLGYQVSFEKQWSVLYVLQNFIENPLIAKRLWELEIEMGVRAAPQPPPQNSQTAPN